MARIHVVTDSGSDLPQEVRDQLGITSFPLVFNSAMIFTGTVWI